jgi:hypothetical protein
MADDYQNGAQGSGQSKDAGTVKDADALFSKLQKWFKLDYDSKGQTEWRREAREDFAFEAGDLVRQTIYGSGSGSCGACTSTTSGARGPSRFSKDLRSVIVYAHPDRSARKLPVRACKTRKSALSFS